jgi:hypothetical protein
MWCPASGVAQIWTRFISRPIGQKPGWPSSAPYGMMPRLRPCVAGRVAIARTRRFSMQGNIVAAARWICAGMICSTLILVGGLVLATFGGALFSGSSGPDQAQRGAPCLSAPDSNTPQLPTGGPVVESAPAPVVSY